VRLVDLTRPLDPRDIEQVPQQRAAAAAVTIPQIDYIRPAHEGVDAMCQAFGCTQDDLPGREGWGAERLKIHSHLGTHVDAPLHYGSTCEGKPARTITDIDLNELYCDGLVLDLRGLCKANEGISVEALKSAIARNGGAITPGCALLLRTGQEAYDLRDREFFEYPGMTREGTLFLAGLGAKVLGTDALGWDRPFQVIRKLFKETGDRSVIWDGHFAGRDREVFIVQQLHDLAAVPPSGFKVGFFPLRLARCSAAPARVVAFVPN
jgi:kynurenine formamidase